jgi:hypothetical protein
MGLTFVVVGVAAELVVGTRFEDFFDPGYPGGFTERSGYRTTVRLGRLTFWVGVMLTLIGAGLELT